MASCAEFRVFTKHVSGSISFKTNRKLAHSLALSVIPVADHRLIFCPGWPWWQGYQVWVKIVNAAACFVVLAGCEGHRLA